jgi:hypothetical protein
VKSSGKRNTLPNSGVPPLINGVSKIYNRYLEWFDDLPVHLGVLSANRHPKKRTALLSSALFDTEWIQDRIEEIEPVNYIRRRFAMWLKGGYVECATDASASG